ncbi:translation initiation factor IF-2 [Candidatus Magnetomoraceae bacterium gMMP-13]
MAKIRVYELARELNMTNRALMNKMQKLDLSVKSHMSALDNDVVDKVRTKIHSNKDSKLDEKRVKSTIIRRRKKSSEKIETSKKQPQKANTSKSVKDEVRQDNAENSDSKKSQSSEKQKKLHKKTFTSEKASEEKPKKYKKRRRSKKKRKFDEAATIIKPAPEPIKKEISSDKSQSPDKKAKNKTTEKKSKKITPGNKRFKNKKEPNFTSKPSNNDKADKSHKRKKKKKKNKKDSPAKIIKLGEVPVQATRETPYKKAPDAFEDAKSSSASIKDNKKKKKFRKKEEPSQGDQKFFNKKISFRKKEVVEASELYSKKRSRGRKGFKKGQKGKKTSTIKVQKTQITTPKAIKRRIKIDEAIVLSELAKRMGIKAGDIIKTLMNMGVMATLNQALDFETATLVASEFNYEVEKASFEEEAILKSEEDSPENLISRPPVVTIMGHVDHGKTSLLDAIRKARVRESEAGGITQHIGAYNVSTNKGQIVFLDTPGHEAFTAMRARGAQVTDIVILVVAADDGVMPQTIEAINHSKAANVPIIVAINKIDKEGADPDRVKRELADYGLVPEDWGGDSIFTNVSAKFGQGIDNMLEMILLQSEVMELKANPDKMARGHVVEAKIDSGRGPVATILVQEGTLHKGDPVVCGIHHGKVRALLNDLYEQTDSATPSIPVEILGLSGVPMAGDEMIAVADEKTAKQISIHRVQKQRLKELAKSNRISLENFYEQMQDMEVKSLNLIIKADVHGSIEALSESLQKLSGEEVKLDIVHSATGTITESDISLAAVSNAIVIGFNVRPNSRVQEFASEENVDVRFYDVIYNVINDIKDAVVGLMESTYKEHVIGKAEIREIFHIPKIGVIAGSYIIDGKIERNQTARLLRDGVVYYNGKIGSLRRFKEDAKEVMSGYECGIGIEHYNDMKVGDIIECYYMEEIKPVLKDNKA